MDLEQSPPPTIAPALPTSYRPLGSLTASLLALLGVQLLLLLAQVMSIVGMRQSFDERPGGSWASAALMARVTDPLVRIDYVVAAIVFCFWVHRAYRNLGPLGARRVRFTPGWAVGYFFIPFVSIVRGVQVMRDLWIESQPLPAASESPVPLRRSASLVGWWWGLWIVTMLATRGVLGEHTAPWTRADWFAFTDELTVVLLLTMVAALLFAAVLRGITRRQRDQWDDLVRRQPTPPRSDLLR